MLLMLKDQDIAFILRKIRAIKQTESKYTTLVFSSLSGLQNKSLNFQKLTQANDDQYFKDLLLNDIPSISSAVPLAVLGTNGHRPSKAPPQSSVLAMKQ